MSTRREFFQTAAGSVGCAAALVAGASLQANGRGVASPDDAEPEPYRQDKPLLELQQAFLDLRFGMFLHFNMATFQDREWGDPEGPTSAFDPSGLDTDSWAAAALSAGMKYGCLTTKHHDGFCLWPTKSGGDSILKTPKKIDVVKKYVDSFRSRGLAVGLYYSILDLRGDIRHHNVTPEKIARIKMELTELLTNYGEINVLIFDGWDAPWSRIPYDEVPFHEIYRLIKVLQPNCLISELNASQYPASGLFYSDIKAFEQNAGQELPVESLIPAQSCVTLTDGWFWKQGDENRPLKGAQTVVEQWLRPQNQRLCNLICNAAPNREGKLCQMFWRGWRRSERWCGSCRRSFRSSRLARSSRRRIWPRGGRSGRVYRTTRTARTWPMTATSRTPGICRRGGMRGGLKLTWAARATHSTRS